MKVLLVNGSPNEEGCTHMGLLEVSKALNQEGIESEIFWIGKKPLGGCIACWKCEDIGKCVFDDTVNIFRLKAYEAVGFVFGTPVHYAAIGGNMTSFMDRLFYSESLGNQSKALRMKPAAAVVSARRAGATTAFDQMMKYFTIQEMPIVSSSYWNMIYGNEPGEVLQDAEGLFTMKQLGKNMAYLLRCQEAGRKVGINPPKLEAKPYTNFIRSLS